MIKDHKDLWDPLGGEVPPLHTVSSSNLRQQEQIVKMPPAGQRGKDVTREILLVPGDRGSTGKPGPQGEQGPSGPVGRAGRPGGSSVPLKSDVVCTLGYLGSGPATAGVKGRMGGVGRQGTCGSPGRKGAQGDPGPRGPKGQNAEQLST